MDVQKMREDLDRLGQKYFNSHDQYEKIKRQHTMIQDECEVMITLLKSVSNFDLSIFYFSNSNLYAKYVYIQ